MINLYPLQKTLCFELRRIDKTGKMSKLEDLASDELEALLDKTLENFEHNKIIEHAEKKANNLEKIKDLFDSVHKEIIEESLEKLSSDNRFNDLISKYDKLQEDIKEKKNQRKKIEDKKDPKYKELTEEINTKQDEVKKNKDNIFAFVIDNFKAHDKYEKIFSDEKLELLKEKYPDQRDVISDFDFFMSYFKGYDRRLKYLYEDEEDKKYTAYKSIPYLLTNYNLPIFYKNLQILEYIIQQKNISNELKNIILRNEDIKNICSFSNYITESCFKSYNEIVNRINQEITKYNNGKNEKYNKENDKFSTLGFLKNLVDLDQNTDVLRKIYDDKELVDIINKFINGLNFGDFKLVFDNIKKYNLEKLYIKNGKYLMDTLELNKNKKINDSYIQLSELKRKDKDACSKISKRADELFKNFYSASEDIKDILKAKYTPNDRNLGRYNDRDNDEIKRKAKEELQSIEVFLNSIKDISEFVSLFIPKQSEDRYLIDFYKVNFDIYNRLNPERLAKVDQIYNHVKTYFTLKDFSTRKIRVNFDIDSFLESWDINQIDSYLGTILIKEEDDEKRYFLGIINKNNFSKFDYVKEPENAYKQMICKYVSTPDSDNEESNKRYKIVKFRNISKDSIDKMVEKDELYLFQIYNKYFSTKSYKTNKNLNTIYWDNIFDEYNIENNIFTINGEAKLFYRPNSLSRKITHPKGKPINNKDENNPKKTSEFKYDLIKDKRYTENKLMVHIPITININSQNIDQSALNQKILDKIKNSEDLHIIGISRSRDELLHATIMDLNGNVKESISLSTVTSRGYDKAKEEDKIFERDYNSLVNKKLQEKIDANKNNNTLKEWQSERSIKDFLTGYTSQVVHKLVGIIKEYNNSILVFEEAKSKNLKDSKLEESLYRDLIKAIITKLSFIADKKESKYQFGSTFNAYQLSYYKKEYEKEYEKFKKAKIEKEQEQDKKGKNKKKSYDENIIQNGIVFHHVPTKLTSDIDLETGFINCFCLSDNVFNDSDWGWPNETFKKFKLFISAFDNITLSPREEIYKPKAKMSDTEERVKVKQCYSFKFRYNKFRDCKIITINKEHEEKEEPCKFLFENLITNIINDKFFDESWMLYSCVDRMDVNDDYLKVDISREFSELFKKYGVIDTEKINYAVLKEFKIVIDSYNLKMDNYSIKTMLINLRNTPDIKKEFDDIFANDIDDKNEKTFEIFNKYHILNSKKIDEFKNNKKNKEAIQEDTKNDIIYYLVKEVLNLVDKYEDTFFEIQDNIKEDIIKFFNKNEIEINMKEEFIKEFIRLFKLMLQMRNYDKKNDYEYILSPVGIRKNGALKFFNSSSDENSSKNVAKKGLLLVKNIKEFKDDLNTLELKVTDEEWISSIIDDKFFVDKQVDENDDKNQSDVIDKKIDENEDKNQSVKNIDENTKETKEKEETNGNFLLGYIKRNKDKKNKKH